MNRKLLAILVVCMFFACVSLPSRTLFAQEQEKKVSIPEAIRQLKKTVVFIGEIHEEPNVPIPPDGVLVDIDPKKIQFLATGFLVSVQGICHLVTAKHVVNQFIVPESKDGKVAQRFNDDGMFIFYNRKDGKVGFRSIGYVKKIHSVNWIFHDDDKVDLAMIPFGISKEDDIRTMPDIMFLDTSKLQELYDVFFIAYQPGAQLQKRIAPIMRTGMISSINDDKTFYIDGFAFPGNSGSPVFLKYSVGRFSETGFDIGGDPLGGKFIGIVGEYIPYRDIAFSAQTKRPRVEFEENTGLSRVWSVNFLKHIEESPGFKQQLIEQQLKNKTPRK